MTPKYENGDFRIGRVQKGKKTYGPYYYKLVDGKWERATEEQYNEWKYNRQVVVDKSGNLTLFGRKLYRDLYETEPETAAIISTFMIDPENRGTNLRVGALYGLDCADCNLTD